MKKIAILASGSSLQTLLSNIDHFKDKDWLWAGFNNFAPNENILRKINKEFDFLYMSDFGDLELRFKQHQEFFARQTNKTFITSPIYWNIFLNKGGGYDSKQRCNLVISSYAIGKNANPQQSYNSLTAYLLALIGLGHRDFILFGADGGGEYFDEATERRDHCTTEKALANLLEDTANMNKIFWSEVSTITSDRVNILNVGLESKLECFNKITMEEAINL